MNHSAKVTQHLLQLDPSMGDFHGISITFPRRQFESTQEIARESPFSMFQ
jgi:hypothetical protein